MFEIKRQVEASRLRGMCIRHDYYTRGTNDEYSNMLLKFLDYHITEKEIEWLAKDIKSHSDTEDEVISIAFNILTEACYEYLVEV